MVTFVEAFRCSACREFRHPSAFCRDSQKPKGFRSSCRDCDKKKRKRSALGRKVFSPVSEKYCPSCDTVKPGTEFNTDRGSRSGLQSKCRDCAFKKSKMLSSREVVDVPESQVCSECGAEKPASSFHRNIHLVAGISSKCKQCHSRGVIQKKYGLDEWMMDKYDAASECEICGEAFSDENGKVVDHCHETNGVRGFLCNPCNKMLGFARDRPAVMFSAGNYLESYIQVTKEQEVDAA